MPERGLRDRRRKGKWAEGDEAPGCRPWPGSKVDGIVFPIFCVRKPKLRQNVLLNVAKPIGNRVQVR